MKYLVTAFAATSVVVALGCGFAAIWSSGPLQGHLAGTAVLAGFTGFLACLVAAAWWDITS